VEDRKDCANDLDNAGRDDGISERHAKNASVLELLEKNPHSKVIPPRIELRKDAFIKHEEGEGRQ
jgi:hypothetical protein